MFLSFLFRIIQNTLWLFNMKTIIGTTLFADIGFYEIQLNVFILNNFSKIKYSTLYCGSIKSGFNFKLKTVMKFHAYFREVLQWIFRDAIDFKKKMILDFILSRNYHTYTKKVWFEYGQDLSSVFSSYRLLLIPAHIWLTPMADLEAYSNFVFIFPHMFDRI